MSTILKSCDGDCSDDACSDGGRQVCPTGYFCAFGNEFEQEDIETECLKGRCANVDDNSVLKTGEYEYYFCSRCAPGYLIVSWKEEYKTKTGEEDCEFLLDSCPQICDPFTEGSVECSSNSECGGCTDTETSCSYGPYGLSFSISCSAEEKRVCSKDYAIDGADYEEFLSGRPKGTVNGQILKKCCGCDGNRCYSCPNPCAGTCQDVDFPCPPFYDCIASSYNYCGECTSKQSQL